MYMYVCIYIHIYTFIYIYIYIHICKNIQLIIHYIKLAYEMYVQQSLRKMIGFPFSTAFVKTGSNSINFLPSGITFHILGFKNDNDSVFLYTDFKGLV